MFVQIRILKKFRRLQLDHIGRAILVMNARRAGLITDGPRTVPQPDGGDRHVPAPSESRQADPSATGAPLNSPNFDAQENEEQGTKPGHSSENNPMAGRGAEPATIRTGMRSGKSTLAALMTLATILHPPGRE